MAGSLTGINDLAARTAQYRSMIVEDQSEVIAFLSDSTSHGAGVGAVERIETHISEIFLAGDRAYKLKRAVKYPYLDFSTAEKRRAACEAELAINRRTAPDLYLGTAAITRDPANGLAIGGKGIALDWLVVMRRFGQENLFDRMAARGALEPAQVADLAAEVARLHGSAEERPEHGGAEGMRAIMEGNETAFRDLGAAFDAGKLARLDAALGDSLGRVAPLLDARRRAGKVRHCHGDLHLRNVVLVDGAPTLFDAIEFSDEIACIDVLYDFAFLLMDLLHRDMRPLANLALNRYLQADPDHEGLACLPLFLSCRAAVRAHVTAAALGAEDGMAARRILSEANDYLDLALASLAPPPPRLVAVGGLSGTGKSTLARSLAPIIGAAPGAIVLRSDVIRKELAGAAPTARLGADSYGDDMSRRVYAAIAERARVTLAAGHAIIADAVYATPDERDAIVGVARAAGTPFAGLWLEAPAETLLNRVSGRAGDASDATAAIVRRQLGYKLGRIGWARLDAAGAPDATLARALEALDLT